ncbi:MAG TPA: MazG-like family protein [Verrucomicrobiae bacterium]|nr:MazG-like family protein [Verrucomicrobiae bacterium]
MAKTRTIRQSDTSFEEISQLIWKHLEERDWLGNSPRGYATSIAIEAGELLEHYQWSEKAVGDKQALADELADILIYCFQYAQRTDIDMTQAIKQKLKKAAQKYPAENFKNRSKADRHQNWQEALRAYRTEKT